MEVTGATVDMIELDTEHMRYGTIDEHMRLEEIWFITSLDEGYRDEDQVCDIKGYSINYNHPLYNHLNELFNAQIDQIQIEVAQLDKDYRRKQYEALKQEFE